MVNDRPHYALPTPGQAERLHRTKTADQTGPLAGANLDATRVRTATRDRAAFQPLNGDFVGDDCRVARPDEAIEAMDQPGSE